MTQSGRKCQWGIEVGIGEGIGVVWGLAGIGVDFFVLFCVDGVGACLFH